MADLCVFCGGNLLADGDPDSFGSRPHDLASIAAWNLGKHDVALEQVKLAIEKSPNDIRLCSNLRLIAASIKLADAV